MSEAVPESLPAETPQARPMWWLNARREPKGPVDLATALELAANGVIHADTLIWAEGMADWTRARDAPGFGECFTSVSQSDATAAPGDEAPAEPPRARGLRRWVGALFPGGD